MSKIFSFFFDKLKKIPYSFYKIVFAVFASSLIFSIKFDLLETYLFDINTKVSASLSLFNLHNPQVAIIQISPDTLKKYDNEYPNIGFHNELLKKLKDVKNSTIVYNFRRVNGQLANIAGTYEQKQQFSDLVSNLNNVFFIIKFGKNSTRDKIDRDIK